MKEKQLERIKGLLKKLTHKEGALDDNVKKRYYDNETAKLLIECVKIIDEIKEQLMKLDMGEVEYKLTRLRGIRSFDLLTDNYYSEILSNLIKTDETRKIIEEYLIEYLNEHIVDDMYDFDDEFHDHAYYNSTPPLLFVRKKRLGKILLEKKVFEEIIPKDFKKYYGEIEQCFLMGYHRAAVGLCRVLIELCFRKKHGSSFRNVKSINKDTEDLLPRRMINEVLENKTFYRDKEFKKKTLKVYDIACNALHGNFDFDESDWWDEEQEVLDIIHKTFEIVETIYSQ